MRSITFFFDARMLWEKKCCGAFCRNARSGEMSPQCPISRFRGIGKNSDFSRHLVLYNLAGFCTDGIKRRGVFCDLAHNCISAFLPFLQYGQETQIFTFLRFSEITHLSAPTSSSLVRWLDRNSLWGRRPNGHWLNSCQGAEPIYILYY